MSIWFIWAGVLILQNLSFTFVSRARNSGSLKRHLVAGLLSNGVWFASQVIMFTQIVSWLKGDAGIGKQVAVGLFYTFFTMLGSLVAHKIALKTEKGSSAVGASAQYAQITKEEWSTVLEAINDLGAAQLGIDKKANAPIGPVMPKHFFNKRGHYA